MRGKAGTPAGGLPADGITPAYAGKRSTRKPKNSGKRDHPRLCGEKLSVGLCSDKMTGSPPPMRGKAYHPHYHLLLLGITPAYAGKSGYTRQRTSGRWDHPRLCGEKQLQKNIPINVPGSPPPMRGKGPVCSAD